jgi:hypothetical protein
VSSLLTARHLPPKAEQKVRQALEANEPLVYFAQAVDGGPIKIGVARDPAERLRRVQTGYPFKLRITNLRPGGLREEGRLHKRFRRHRIRGEWFAASDDLARLAKAHPASRTGRSAAIAEARSAAYSEGFQRGLEAARSKPQGELDDLDELRWILSEVEFDCEAAWMAAAWADRGEGA